MRVVVLGAGVIGVASAYWLARDGHAVTVVEGREGAGLGTSWGNGAIIHVSSVSPWAAPGVPREVLGMIGREDAPMLLRLGALPHMWRWGLAFLRNCQPERHRANARANLELALESVAALGDIADETGVAYERRRMAVLKTFADEAALAAAARAHDELAPFGLVTERLDRQAVVAMEPALEPVAEKVAGGLFFPQDELGDCHLFSTGLAAWLATRGVAFRYGTRVTGIGLEGGRVARVATDKGEIAVDAVVVALGTGTPAMLRPFRIHLPIYPVKGVSLTASRHGWNGAPRMAILDDSRHVALVPIGERIRVAGSAEVSGYDPTPAPARIQAVLRRLYEIFPGFRPIAEGPTAVPWAGLRPMVPDGRPIIGGTAIPGLYVNSGHGHTGWTMAAGSGGRLADAVAGRARVAAAA